MLSIASMHGTWLSEYQGAAHPINADTQLNSTQEDMTPQAVERMLIDDARLLARRDE